LTLGSYTRLDGQTYQTMPSITGESTSTNSRINSSSTGGFQVAFQRYFSNINNKTTIQGQQEN